MLAQGCPGLRRTAQRRPRESLRWPADFRVRNLAGAMVGVMMSASLAIADGPAADFAGVAGAALAHPEAGLPL